MNNITKWLVFTIALELGLCGYLTISNVGVVAAPLPTLTAIDSLTAKSLTKLATQCKTAEEWHTLGNTYMSAGFFAEASACYEQATRLKPDWGEALFNHGFCLSRFGQTEQANIKFQQVVDLRHKKLADAVFFMAQNHLRDEAPELAEEAFRRAAPSLPMAKYELARILFRKDQFDEAEKLLAEVLNEHPKASRVKLLLAEISVAKNNENRATNFRIEGTDVTDRLPTPFVTEKNRLGATISSYGFENEVAKAFQLLEHNRIDTAKSELQLLQKTQWSPSVHSALVDISIQQNLFDDAEQLIEEELELSGPTTLWLSRLGNVRMIAGNISGAVEAWKLGIEVRNDKSVENCMSALGQHYEQEGNLEASEKYQHMLMTELARRSLKEGNARQAIEQIDRGMALVPNDAELYFLLGKARRILLEHPQALAAFDKCLALKPNHGKALREREIVQ
ncbi:MAG: tetratricopeptide repeat protein [Mariniblastus sp.]|nr:tetratricopeptide repeat protein [Mariniblastus sp.]